MYKIIWLITGNKGGCGKSVMAKCMVEWLHNLSTFITVVDGDTHTSDVATVFSDYLSTAQFDLHDVTGWLSFSDYLCAPNRDEKLISHHIVTNLPDRMSYQVMSFFERFIQLTQAYDFQVKVLFVMNALPDGLYLFGKLTTVIPEVIPVKNLAFAKAREFIHFDATYGLQQKRRILLLPGMNPRIMQVVRASNLSFADFLSQTGNQESNFVYAKVVVAEWRERMLEALNDTLYTDAS
ncbi:hypothetical protein [Candidatus Glomeribacter gigasporarum]|uniref:hypothetical protein n=1 Tax=Candidatus Glomeribacter gigasporarum TaxID=132144 RepID=UPI0005B26AE0|nr:hypothetical protein [Candidatus Glomeribacter gigasporarum]